ncbi:hypothetical protein BKA82DRAFT_994450 [Pisolithus tinctorius]|uniref:Protein CPL1-like domain-containing protein n=1 Tax=Pisolithus tinctorius Marx 270 TaxID=870435 RepID=A0A0C3PSX4_PISTI|nr:hypothetical protein BKA82DRAFT_994450 [Pisolithus tinctorius]KIO11779.1 hypothetical protein M404DRAFT_994450 [Pisolithus tinctorius Marx 270]
MRLSAFVVTPLVLASTAFARSHFSSRVHRRASLVTDYCAHLDANLVFPDFHEDAGHLDVSICTSQINTFVEANHVAQAAVKAVGLQTVQTTLVSMIKHSGTECSFPPHSELSPTPSNVCDFKCTDGFLAMPPDHPTSCQCPSHLTVCDGKCGHFHADQCAKTTPPSRRQSEHKCADGLQMCGTSGTSNGQSWKCVDVNTDPMACGGCVKPSPFGSSTTNGVNCKEIPNVKSATCSSGKCVVQECEDGYNPTSTNDACIPASKGLQGRSTGAPLTPSSSAASTFTADEHRRDNFGADLGHGEALATKPLSVVDVASAGFESKPKETIGGLAHGSEIGIPGVGAFSTTTNAAFRVDHRDLVGSATQVKNNPESATGQLRQGGTNITPAGGFSHGTNAGVKASRRGLVPLNVAHGSKMEDLARKAPREDPTSMVSGGYVQSESSPSDETFPENEGKD